MLGEVIKLFRAFITIAIALSLGLGVWTGFALFTKGPYKREISSVVENIYKDEIAFLGDINDLTSLLFKDSFNKLFSKDEISRKGQDIPTKEIISESILKEAGKTEGPTEEIMVETQSEQVSTNIINENEEEKGEQESNEMDPIKELLEDI